MREDFKCGTFMDWSFGGWLRRLRVKSGKTLRTRVTELKMDAGNYSKLERGLLAPPGSKKDVERLLRGLKVSATTKEMIY